jgi:predicted TIM-barrel fold metal-dependent hydrolase
MENKSPVIVDCHAHLWETARQLGQSGRPWRLESHPSAGKSVSAYDLKTAASPVAVTFLLGFRSKLLGVDIPNKFISDCVYQYRESFLGFGAIDPTTDNVLAEAKRIREEYKLAGFVLSPGGQGFHPTSTQVCPVYEYARKYHMPIFIHNGQPFGTPATEFTDPTFWGPVFREYGEVKFVITDMGRPWTDQTVTILSEFENVYMDLAGFTTRPWVGYQTLIKGYQEGVLDKYLLGSDFPEAGSATVIEAIYSINQLVSNSNLPTIPRQRLREIVERNTLQVLGLSGLISVATE